MLKFSSVYKMTFFEKGFYINRKTKDKQVVTQFKPYVQAQEMALSLASVLFAPLSFALYSLANLLAALFQFGKAILNCFKSKDQKIAKDHKLMEHKHFLQDQSKDNDSSPMKKFFIHLFDFALSGIYIFVAPILHLVNFIARVFATINCNVGMFEITNRAPYLESIRDPSSDVMVAQQLDGEEFSFEIEEPQEPGLQKGVLSNDNDEYFKHLTQAQNPSSKDPNINFIGEDYKNIYKNSPVWVQKEMDNQEGTENPSYKPQNQG